MSPRKRNIRSGKGGMQVQRSPARVDCFRVSPRPVEDEPEIAGDRGGKRLQPLRLPLGRQRLVHIAQEKKIVEDRHVVPGMCIVRIDFQRQFPFAFGGSWIMVECHQNGGHCGVRGGKARIERQRRHRRLASLSHAYVGRIEMMRRHQLVGIRHRRPRPCKARIARSRGFVILDGAPKTMFGPLVPAVPAFQIKVVCLRILGRLRRRRRSGKVWTQGFHDDGCDLILDREQIRHWTIPAVRAEVISVLCLDELHRDADRIAGLPHGPFHDEIRMQLLSQRADIASAPSQCKAGCARHDVKLLDPGEVKDQLLGDPVAEVGVIPSGPKVDKRNHRDRSRHRGLRRLHRSDVRNIAALPVFDPDVFLRALRLVVRQQALAQFPSLDAHDGVRPRIEGPFAPEDLEPQRVFLDFRADSPASVFSTVNASSRLILSEPTKPGARHDAVQMRANVVLGQDRVSHTPRR